MQRRRLVTSSVGFLAVILVATLGVIQVVSADAAKIDVATISVNPGATGFLIPVTVTTQDAPGMAAFDVTITYDNSVINVTGRQDGPSGFSLTDNLTAGSARVAGFTFGTSASGSFNLFNLVATAVGSAGASTNLTMTVTSYGDSGGSAITIGTTQNGSVTINTPSTFSISPSTLLVNESAGNADLTVTLDPTSSSKQTISVNTSGGTATAGADYTALSGSSQTVTIAANTANATVTVPILQDTLDESNETFNVVLSGPSNDTVLNSAASSSTVTVIDDDVNPTVSVSTASISQSEGNASNNITFQANLSTASGQSVTVGFATQDGTASGTTDFTTKSGTLTFSPGSTFATTSIEIKGDTAYEADETFTIKLSNGQTIKATESISIHNATTFVTLQNDDTPVANADSYNATEDTLLTVNAASGVLGNDPNHFTRTASLVTNGSKGTASLNSDGSFTYTPTANANGNDSFTYKYNDGRFDSNATTVAISITAVNDAPVAVDDVYDAQPGNVLSVPAAGILTNDTDVDTGDTKTVDSPSTIALSPVITGTSLTVNANGSFEYTPGSNTQGQTFAYVVRDTAGATSTATVTLRLGPAFSIVATSSVTETEAPVVINLAVTTTQATDTPIQVKYRTVNGDALGGEDYTAVTSGTITIPANGTTSTAPITILGDTRHESVETFRVELFGADVGTSVQNAASTTVVTITDNDTAPSVSISAVAPSAVEGDAGTTTLTFTVTQTAISGLKTTVNYTTADGTANAVSDYLTSSGALTIAAGAQTATISVTVNGDGSFEADETFKVKLTSATNAATSSPAEVTHTILNDDNPTAATDPYTAIEDVQLVKNAAAGVLANDDTATGPTITAVLVTPVASSAGVLALAPDGSFTFTTAKDSTTTATFTYKVRALFSTGARQFESTPTTVTITIDPRNDAPVAVDDQLTASPSNDTPANILANDIDVDNDTLLIVNASGISAADLVPQSATGSGTTLSVSSTGTLLYNPGTSNIPQAFVYTVTDGTLTATATVSFSQGPTFFVSVLNSPVDEDASTIDVEVKLVNAATTSQSTVKLSMSQTGSTATLGADVGTIPGADSSGALTITLGGSGGVATTTIQVPVINDTATPVREGPETVQFVLADAGTSPTGGQTPLIATAAAVATIDDKQDIPKLTIADVTLEEATGNAKSTSVTGKVTVTLTGRTNFSTGFMYSVESTSTAPAGSSTASGSGSTADFLSVTGSSQVTIGPNTTLDATTTQVSVTIFNDNIDELPEVFLVRLLSGATEKALELVTIQDGLAVVTIEDDDNAPTIEILAPADQLESSSPATISVKLNGASGAGVKVNYATSNGTATAGSDYTATTGTLTWAADETGNKTFTVVITDDTVEEDGETVTLTLSGTSTVTTSPSTPGVSIATGTATLLILDDEPAAAIVTVMSDGEAAPGDGYFLIVAGSDSAALSLSSVASAQLTSPMSQTLMPIANVSEVVRKMLGLDKLRSKNVTHAWYAMAATSTGQQSIAYNVTLNYSGSKTHNVSASLNVVTARTNRNFWIQDGANFVGLGLVPNDTSIANLLKQPVSNSNPAFEGALSRQVTLADVIQSIFSYFFTAAGGWNDYHTDDPISGAVTGGSLTQLAPFQGMIIKSRSSVTPNNASSIDVFESVNVPGVGTTTVPVKINVQGPYLASSGNNPPLPVSQQLRIGFNLIAPHVWAPTPFDTAFGGTGGFVPGAVFGSAISSQSGVFPISVSPSVVGAMVASGQPVTESPAIPPFVAPGTIDPILSYWVRVAQTGSTTAPTITATGPNGHGP